MTALLQGPVRRLRRRPARSGLFALSAVLLVGACEPAPSCAPQPTDAPGSAGPAAAPAPPPAQTPTPPPAGASAPPVGAQFFEDFVTSAGADRFDWQLHASSDSGTPCGPSTSCSPIWATDHAEHDMACGAPTTRRTIPAGVPNDFTVLDPDVTPNIYYCAPGGDVAKGHMMTAVDTDGVVIVSFSPKQTFRDVRKVCFDVNTNTDIGAGKWVNAWIVPVSSIAANGGRFDFADAPDLDPQQQAPGPNDFHFKYFDGSLVGPNGFDWWAWDRRASESATRFTQCVEQTAPGQLTYTRDLPVDANRDGVMEPGVGETLTQIGSGNLPDGDVRVIFQDGNYNPSKHGGAGAITWHWDNISVT